MYSLFLTVSGSPLVLSRSNRQCEQTDGVGLAADTHTPQPPSQDQRAAPSLLQQYQRAAPRLLQELAHCLSQEQWTGSGCSIPQGVVNILNDSWHNVTVGMVHLSSPEQTAQPKGRLGAISCPQGSATGRRGAGETESQGGAGSVPGRRPQVSPKPCVKKHKQKSSQGK